MKTLRFFATCVAIVAMSFMNVTMASNGQEFVYNDVNNANGQVMTRMVYKNNNDELTQYRQLKFNYDAEGRVLSKETLQWNAIGGEWENHELLTFTYVNGTPQVTRLVWNGSKYAEK